MRSCVVLLFASLLTLCEAQGTIVTPVFVLKGRDLLLNLHADPPEKFLFVDWKINKKDLLVRFIHGGESYVNANFTGRVQFGENKFSAILKNVQEVDSGVYSAEARILQEVKLLTQYKVTVQDPHRGWMIAVCILIVIVVVLFVCLYKYRKRLIGLIKRYPRFKDEVVLRFEKHLNEHFAPQENMSPAGASGPSYSSVPSAAEPTDP